MFLKSFILSIFLLALVFSAPLLAQETELFHDDLTVPWCGEGYVRGAYVQQTLNLELSPEGDYQLQGTGRTTITLNGSETVTDVEIELGTASGGYSGIWVGDDGVGHDFAIEAPLLSSPTLTWLTEHDGLGAIRVDWNAHYHSQGAIVYLQNADGDWIAEGRLFFGAGDCREPSACPFFDVCSCTYVCGVEDATGEDCPWDCSPIIAEQTLPHCQRNLGVCEPFDPDTIRHFDCEPYWDQCFCRYFCPDPLAYIIAVEPVVCDNECPEIEYEIPVCAMIDGQCQQVEP